jgi:NAD(P)-dependent dehydrogenase (short-subunit alcohol dehydrogenase family)
METVLITGASSGIGADMAHLFADRGYEVILCGRNTERLERVASDIKTTKHLLPGDITDPQYRKSIKDFLTAKKHQGRFSTLINNAGIYSYLGKAINVSESDYRAQFEVNFLAPVLLTIELYELLKINTPASVLMISSTLGLKPIPGTNHYSAQKAALINWTECTALDWAKDGIRVNCLCPGLIETPIHQVDLTKPEIRKSYDEMQPMGKMGTPRDISEAAYFLSSKASKWTTGSVLSVDGGVRLV